MMKGRTHAPRIRRWPHVLQSAAQLTSSGPGAGRTCKLMPEARLAWMLPAMAAAV